MAGVAVRYCDVAVLIGRYLGISAVDKVGTVSEENKMRAKSLSTRNN